MHLVFIRFLGTNRSHTPVSESDSSEQISNTGIDVASNTKEVKQQVVRETEVPAAEVIGQESQQPIPFSEKTFVKEKKTVEQAMPQAGYGNELNVSDAEPFSSGTIEQTANRVTVVGNEIEQIKQVLMEETVATKTLTGSVQQSSASPVVVNTVQRPNTDVANTVQEPNKDLMSGSEPDFPRHNENVSGVSESASSEQISSSEIDLASNIKEVKRQGVVVETETAVVTVVQGSQQLASVSEKAAVNQDKMVEGATLHAGIRNEVNVSDAGHAASNSTEQTSNNVIVVANEIEEVKQLVVEETIVRETLTERAQQSSTSPENTIVDDPNNIGEDNESGETDPEHVVTLESAESYQLSEGSTNPESTVQVANKDALPIIENDLDSSLQDGRVSGTNSNEPSGIVQGDDGYAGRVTNNLDPCIEEGETPILKNEIPVSQKLNELSDKIDEIFGEMLTAGTGNVDDEQRAQELVQQSEDMKKGEKTGCNAKLNLRNEGPMSNSDARGEENKVSKMVGGNVKTKAAGNGQQIAKENSEGEPKTNSNVKVDEDGIQKTVIGKKGENDESGSLRRVTRSTTRDASGNATKSQQSGGVEVCLSNTSDI